MKGCVDVPILDDTLAMEGTERFDLTLDTPHGIPSSPPRTSRVSVLDDDGKLPFSVFVNTTNT